MIKFFWPVLGIFVVLQLACAASEAAVDIPLTHLTSYEVVDVKGNPVAQVEDILIADNGQISYALVTLERRPFDYGKAAFSQASVPRTAVPWEYFLIDTSSAQLQLQVERAVLYAAPLLLGEPSHLETSWDATIRAYWKDFQMGNDDISS